MGRQKFFEELSLQEETDPNKLYDIQSAIKAFKLFTQEQVEEFCTNFYDENRDEGSIHPMLDAVVDLWNTLVTEEKEDFRLKVASYNRLYSYLSQIINFTDLELEKHYLFYRYLYKKLKRPDVVNIDITNLIDLESLRIQKLHTGIDPLTPEGYEYPGIQVNPQTYKHPNRDLLSEIIDLVNTRYGITLTDDDRVNLESVRQKIFDDEEIKKYMNGANSQQNKEDFMKKQFDNVMLEFLNSRFDFFKKINDNDSLKKLIFEKIYSDYVRNQSELRK